MITTPNHAPRAPVRPTLVRSAQGDRVDPYYWLRDDSRENPEVLAHLAAENAYTERCLAPWKPVQEEIFREIVGRIPPEEASVPYLELGYWYYSRYEAGREHPIYARRRGTLEAPEEVVLDANERASGHEYYQVGALEVSPNGEWLAVSEDFVGRREYTLAFKNLRTGEWLSERIADVEAGMAWANDDATVVYVEKDRETLLGRFVKRHRLGTDPLADTLLFEQSDPSFYTGVSKSKSHRFVFLHMESTVSSEWRFAEAADPTLEFRVFLPHRRDHEYQIEHVGERFIVRSNWQARNFRLLEAPIGEYDSPAPWRELVAHREDTYIEDFEPFERFVAVSVRHAALARIAIHPLGESTFAPRFVTSDESAYTMALSINPGLTGDVVRYAYSSLTTPTTIYDYDVRTGERILRKRDAVLGGFDPAAYRTELIFAPARDGARIPVSLVCRRDVRRDGSAPLLQYAYGAYGLSMDPAFSSARLSLLERGFVYAIAHVRGGQELGRAWYDAGRMQAKRHSFEDFIDVTRHLVAEGYAAADRVYAMGGSAGGLLIGAVANLAPGAYRGMVAQVPFVDVVTTMLDDGIPLTTNEYDEWGDPADPADYAYMLSYSPYDNVRAQDYPALLVTTGLWDSQVQYYEPAKWVAKLRAFRTDDRPVLLHVELDAGHGGKAGRFERHRETALEYAFLLALEDARGAGDATG